jgi:hypothetical protein
MSAGAAEGAAAAAAIAEAMRQEEEEMTPYQPNDLADGWEFKIVRSGMNAFKNPERMRAILEEESKAGWILVEKFDNQRIRLKRPAFAKNLDPKLDFDPYRTYVGTGEGHLAAVIIALIFGGLLLVATLLATARR